VTHIATAALSSILQRRFGVERHAMQGLRALDPARARFAGPAATVRYLPRREDRDEAFSPFNAASPFAAAFEQVADGAVLVIDAAGDERAGILGEMLATRLLARGCAGVVCDGGMRDVVDLAAVGLPIAHRGPAPASSTASLMLVDYALPVSCAGATVFPGDWIVADEDGVVVCPAELWEKARAEVEQRAALETWVRRRLAAGEPMNGLYPPTEAVKAQYARWVAAGSPPDRLVV
jgi:regulator of RNase E activity RraA